MHSNIFAVTAALAATATAFDCHGPYFSFYNRHGPAMSSQRLDPALFPGQQSPHMHDFDGGNGLGAEVSFASLQGSECTTARIKPDKSVYWRPTLYWNGNGTGFYPVPNNFLKIYYKFGDAGNAKARNVSEFPEDFSMIAGDPFRRTEDEKNEAGIDWTCIGKDYSRITAKGFPTGFTSCEQGLTTQLTFPACWNGDKIDPKNPSAHMAYPTNSGSGIDACPEGFQAARFPSIFIEFWWDVKAFDGQYSANDNPWVLSHGDPTGHGFHADFKNGWAKGVLAKAVSDNGYCDCGCGCGDDQMRECFGAENVNTDADFAECAAKSVFEDETGVVEKLPGCNPIQSGPEEATLVTGPECTAAGASVAEPVTSATSAVASPVSSASSEVTGVDNASSLIPSAQDVEATATPFMATDLAPGPTVTVTITAESCAPTATETVKETVTVTAKRHYIKHRRHGINY